MQNGIGGGRFVDKRLGSGRQDGTLFVEVRSFRAVVADVQQESVRQLPLNIQTPDLHVAQAVVLIKRVVIGDLSCCSRKSVYQRQVAGCRVARRIGLRVGKGRLKRKVLDDRAVLRQVVVDPVAESDHGKV